MALDPGNKNVFCTHISQHRKDICKSVGVPTSCIYESKCGDELFFYVIWATLYFMMQLKYLKYCMRYSLSNSFNLLADLLAGHRIIPYMPSTVSSSQQRMYINRSVADIWAIKYRRVFCKQFYNFANICHIVSLLNIMQKVI